MSMTHPHTDNHEHDHGHEHDIAQGLHKVPAGGKKIF